MLQRMITRKVIWILQPVAVVLPAITSKVLEERVMMADQAAERELTRKRLVAQVIQAAMIQLKVMEVAQMLGH